MTAEAKIKLSVDGASAAVTNISSVTASLGGLSDKAKDFQGLWKGLAGSLTVGALTMQVKSIIDAADSMNDLSQQVGIGVQQLGKYQLATAQSGTTMEAMAKGVKALSVNMAEHSDELKKAGITATTADGALLQLADVFAAMPDGIEKTALANKLFGKSGMELIPMLNLGSAGLQESAEKSAKYAATLELLAPQADRFNDQMAELGLHTKVGSMAIVNDAMPAMISITAAMAAAAQEGGLLMAMWVGLGGAMHEFVAKPFQVLFLGINNTIDEANARLMLFFRQTAEADKLYAVVAQRNKQILALTTENPAPAPAAVKTFDTKKWTADYKALMDAIGGSKGTAKEAASEFDRLAKSGAELAASLIDVSGGLSGDFAKKWESLSAAYQSGAISLDRLVLAQKKLLEQQPAMVAEFKAATKAAEDRQAAYLKEAAGIEAFMLAQQEAANASIKSVSDRIASLRAEEEAVAISQAQNISLAAAVELVAIARLKEEQARKFVPGYEGWEAIQREIDKRQELLGLMNTKDLREREQSGWLSFYNSLDQTAHDTFTNVLEGGQGIWTKIRNTAKSVFFDWLYQMTDKKWLFNLTVSASGGALPASAGAGSLGGTGGLSNLTTLAGMGGSFSAGIGAGFSSLIGEAGIMGGLDAGMIAMQAGNIAGGLGTLAGVLGPIALGIGAVYMLAKNLDHSGTPHTGAGTAYSAATGLAQASAGASGAGLFSTGIAYDQATEQLTTQLATSMVSVLDGAAKAVGKTTGYGAAVSYADDKSKDGAYASVVISKLGEVLSGWGVWKGNGQVLPDGEAGTAEFLARATADVQKQVREILAGTDWAVAMVDALGSSPSLDQLAAVVEKINQVQSAIASERAGLQQQYDLLAGVTTQREIERAALDESNRSLYDQIQALQDQQAASEAAAQAAQAVADERAGLQQQYDLLAGITTQRDIERAALDESNRALYDQIQALQEQKTATEAAANAAAEAERAQAEQAQRIADQRASLQDQLDSLTLTAAQQLERQRNALDESNRALFDQVQAATAAAEAERALAEQTQRVASERASLQDQLDNLTLTANQLLEKQRNALDESNRALFDQVQAATAAAKAAAEEQAAQEKAAAEAERAAQAMADAAQRAADEAAAAAQRIASEHDSLWRQYLSAAGDTAALRALELAALDPANRALQQQVWALQDQKEAADAATAAAQAVASEHDGLYKQYLTAIGDTAALRQLELDALDPANRALQQQIWAIEDNKVAAEKLSSAWSSLTDSITDEVRRIRGLIDESSGASYASLQAQFAIATAQTRAGDQEAARLLPGLSQSMLTAYESSATSLVDLQRQRALTANSLEQTAALVAALGPAPATVAPVTAPGTATATGTGAKGTRGTALAAGASTAYAVSQATPATPAYGLSDMVVELRGEISALKDEVRGLRGESRATSEAIAINTGKTARLNQKWDDVGLPITTETDLVAVYGA